jgi:hypothetical protein
MERKGYPDLEERAIVQLPTPATVMDLDSR